MSMTATAYLAHFKRVKAYLDDHPDASDELRRAHEADGAAFKVAYTPGALKQAIASGATVDVNLEDRITSTLLLLNRERARRGARS